MFIGRKKKEIIKIGSAFDRLLNYAFKKDEDMNAQLLDLAEYLMANRPVLANFEEIKNLTEVNYAIAFLSGIVYALGGSVYSLGCETRLFATAEAFQDGTLQKYIKDFGQNE